MNKKTPKTPTKQGDYVVGNKKPPKERQFGQPGGNPRHNGAWKKKDTLRYKLEQMMKMTETELRAVAENKDAPLLERKLAICINKGQWKEIREMMDEVYGAPKQQIVGEIMEYKPLVDLTKRRKNGE